jgi:hypothetical protein
MERCRIKFCDGDMVPVKVKHEHHVDASLVITLYKCDLNRDHFIEEYHYKPFVERVTKPKHEASLLAAASALRHVLQTA